MDPRWRLGLTLCGSVLLHGLILYWPVKPLQPAAARPGLSVELLQTAPPPKAASASPVLTGTGPDKVAAPDEAPPPPPDPVGDAGPENAGAEGPGAMVEVKPSLPQWLADLAPAADTNYYAANEVDVRALPRGDIEVEFPGDLPQPDASGRVLLEVLIDEYGVVDEVTVLSSMPPGVFDAYAVQSFRRARFSPAIKNGRHVRSRKEIDVCYGDCASVAPAGRIIRSIDADGTEQSKDANGLLDKQSH